VRVAVLLEAFVPPAHELGLGTARRLAGGLAPAGRDPLGLLGFLLLVLLGEDIDDVL